MTIVSKKIFWFFFTATVIVMSLFQNCAPVQFKEDFIQVASTEAVSCRFNGLEILSGQGVKAYQNSSVPFGESCQEEERTCENGNLSGSYNFATCEVGVPASCLFDGRTIAHGDAVTAYLNSSVAFGQACAPETRRCNNGSLSGSYTYANCGAAAPASCSFNGQTVAHGQSVLAYLSSSVPYGSTCSSQSRVCSNGVLSGSHQYASCTMNAAASCLFNGRTVAHGESVNVFASSTVPYGSNCLSAAKVCNNGVMTGPAGYEATSCSPGAPANCSFNGSSVAHGSSVVAFASSSVPYGSSCQQENRVCNNGVLSGSFGFGSCIPGTAASCQFAGVTYPHGATINAYLTSTGNPTCVPETRQCNNGSWTGSYPYKSCSVSEYFWGGSAFVSGPVGSCTPALPAGLPPCTEANSGAQVPDVLWYCSSGETLRGTLYCRSKTTNYN